ncbi:lipopolysaccharide biosynthesis protein [Massilia niastensis]|uniref:lipopolysaccharide biosynthesis protein n=1 Tax=Massilia niastensis TaxID=544911 RepID=UPI00146F491F|nr:polysaccharide biosynthesis C-terminal domain-containing protein [Massilia niastensis]
MKNLLSLGRTPDARFDLSAAIGSTLLRQIVSSSLYFVALWITTRQLGPHDNGLLATALLLPQTLYAVLNLGLAPSHVYHMSSGLGSPAAMRRMNWRLALALWGLAALGLGLTGEAVTGRYLPGTAKSTALYASILFPMMLLAAWTVALIQGARDYPSYNKTALIQPLSFCAGVVALGAAQAVSVVSVLGCHILSQAALWLAGELRVRRYTPAAGAPALKPGKAVAFGLRAHLSNVITFLNYRVALYLVSFLLDPASAGQYALSVQLAEVLWLIASAASVVVFPESAAHNSTPAALQAMVGRIARSVFRITLLVGLLAGLLSLVAIPWVFGRAYAGSVLPFIILLPGIITWSYMNIVANSLAGMGCQRVNILGALLSLALNGIGCLLAIPVLGMQGAALASSVAFTATAGYTVCMYRRIMAARIAQAGARRQAEPGIEGSAG